MQALSFSSAGTPASTACVKRTLLHQHSTQERLAAETAHPFGCPHRGHSGAFSAVTCMAGDSAAWRDAEPRAAVRAGLTFASTRTAQAGAVVRQG